MKILVLTSRYTASRDIIGEDFGRQTRLFSALRRRGHDITFFVADYRKRERKNRRLHGMSILIRPFSPLFPFSFIRSFRRHLDGGGYDAVVGTSDPLWGLIGYHAARRHGIPFVYDWHDNYETYASYRLPFFRYLDRRVVRDAEGVTAVSHALKEKLRKIRKGSISVIQNGVDMKLFRPLGKKTSRKKLGLPLEAPIISYTGSLQKTLGVDRLVRNYRALKADMPELRLLLVGRLPSGKCDRPDIYGEGIIHFDAVKQEKVVLAINAADVAVIPGRPNAFTRYCFPYKCVEYMACNATIIASALSDVPRMLSHSKESLFRAGDDDDMRRCLKKALAAKKRPSHREHLKSNTWNSIARDMEKALSAARHASSRRRND